MLAMASTWRRVQAFALLALLAAPSVHAQLTGLPNLQTLSSSAKSTAATSATTSAQSSQSSGTSASTSVTSAPSSSVTTSETITGPTLPATATTIVAGLTGLPTIAGASIPTLIIPYTADAPFMRKSNLPEGTVFIIVGAILGFLGACVLAWRCLIAWSINRSVKRSALASIRGSEKNSTWGGSGAGTNTYYSSKGGYYSEYAAGSSMSLDALNSAGKQLHKPSHRDSETHSRHTSAVPPAGLFFSPTAQTAGRNSLAVDNMSRNSTFLPAGYYASPSAAQPAGGAHTTTVGGSLAPYARQSMASPSPPGTANGPASSRGAAAGFGRDSSREGLRPADGGMAGRPGTFAPSGGLYNHPSSSSLMVGTGGGAQGSDVSGTRAPSAYLDDLFENHGHGPRERF